MTPDGYSFSSAYVPATLVQPHQQPYNARELSHRGVQGHAPQPSRGGGGGGGGGRGGSFYPQRTGFQSQTHWYESGNHKCTHEQCAFTGSKKSVEIHMMDRHLIFPPGWDNRKRKSDWDADPSLKNGKPIPIQGTGLVLDTPEAIDTWIADRRKRWPTVSRVEEKDRKLQDAIARGEISASDPSLRGKKRPRTDDGMRGRGQPRGRGSGRGTGRGGGHVQTPMTVHALPRKPIACAPEKEGVPDDDDDDASSSGSDMDPEKDAVTSKPQPGGFDLVMSDKPERVRTTSPADFDEKVAQKKPSQKIQPVFRKPAPQPKAPPHNPFASRPSLLRNLLLPEIRMTVSNLSQTIHFLVENNFLEDVELNPGDADNKPIEVVGESSHEAE
ncbi:hypothetical protein DFH11DRAFT_1500361 [Phellopilus nigrolimitatus]|nr:hypothetical protein DFH11DRAFT_1500361 [Phellopilus nigrolimitatus]